MSTNPQEREEYLKALMVKTQSGDQDAYKELLHELSQLIYAYCRKSLPTEETAEDCRQDILLSLHRVRHTYDPSRSFHGWIYAIIKNKIVDYYRKSGRLKAKEVVDSEQVDLAGSTGEQERSDAQMTIQTVLAELSEEFREPLILSKIHGFSTREIAGKLGISESLVKVRVFRALSKLKSILEKDQIETVTKSP